MPINAILALALAPASVVADFAPLGAKSAREISIPALTGQSYWPICDRISRDGTMLFGGFNTPLYDLTTGRAMWTERIHNWMPPGKKDWSVGTLDQYQSCVEGAPEPFYGDLADAQTRDHWLAQGGVEFRYETDGTDNRFFLGEIDVAARGDKPNRQTPYHYWKGYEVNSARPHFMARFASNGDLLSEHFYSKANGQMFLESVRFSRQGYKQHVNRIVMPPSTTRRTMLDFNAQKGTVLGWMPERGHYNQSTQKYVEDSPAEMQVLNIRSSQWSGVPAGQWARWWRGQLCEMPEPGYQGQATGPTVLWKGSQRVVIGDYDWYARSSDQRYALVRHGKDVALWLIDFGSGMPD